MEPNTAGGTRLHVFPSQTNQPILGREGERKTDWQTESLQKMSLVNATVSVIHLFVYSGDTCELYDNTPGSGGPTAESGGCQRKARPGGKKEQINSWECSQQTAAQGYRG